MTRRAMSHQVNRPREAAAGRQAVEAEMIPRRGPATGSNGAASPAPGGERTALWRSWLHRSPNAAGDTPRQLAQLLLLALSAAVALWNVEAER